MDKPAPARSPVAVPLAVLGVAIWVASVFGHAWVGGMFGTLFGWGRRNGVPIEKWIFGVMAAIGTAFVIALLARLARAPRTIQGAILARVVVWVVFAAALERYFLYIQSELMHFIQYGGTALLLSPLLGPRGAFLAAGFGGFFDELHQYWAYHGMGDDPESYLDWNDMILDLGGASGGALPALALALVRRSEEGRDAEPEPPAYPTALVVLGIALALIFVAGPRIDFGHYPIDPWKEYPDNFKPHHVLTVREGFAALAAATAVFVFILDPRRRGLPVAGIAVLLVLLHVAVPPTGTRGPFPVPEAAVRDLAIEAPLVFDPVKVDGVLDEPAWAKAPRVELKDAVDPSTRERWRSSGHREAPVTHARVLWDARRLYLAFEVQDDDAWARDVPRDTTTLPGDEVVELFLDVDGAGTTYYELEVSPRNVVYDLLVQRPTPPAWRPLPQGFLGHENWDWRGMESAVRVDGELEVLAPDAPLGVEHRKAAPSKGWTVELALPFLALKGRRVPPVPGDTWRLNLTRVERPRPTKNEDFEYPELTSWAPLGRKDNVGYVSFHRPWRFGFLRFTERPADR